MRSFISVWGAFYAVTMFGFSLYVLSQTPVDYPRVMIDMMAAIFGVLVYIATRVDA